MTIPNQVPEVVPSRSKGPARKRPADYTGRLTEQLAEDKKAEQLEASQRIAMVTAQQQEIKSQVVDYTDSEEPLPEVELRSVEVSTPYRMIRVNADIKDMTFGRKVIDPGEYQDIDISKHRPAIMGPMNMYTFNEGQLYRVTKDVADHLNSIGYIAYMSGA